MLNIAIFSQIVSFKFLVCFIVSAQYFITLTYSRKCEGLFCHQRNSSKLNLSSYIDLLVVNSTTASPTTPVNKIPFQGIIKSHQLNKKCCYNGGSCFLGRFCLCPYEYTGRLCEYEKWPRNCPNGILNGQWVVRGCSLCRCFSGELHCLAPQVGCEEEQQDDMTSVGTKLHHCCVPILGLTLVIILLLF
ncbi:cryptic protein-like [Leptodactylus fuscus]|uniref:cryptic protein-like n=1 Tax=Leptodactylus fuscus TaxID=238119 RepID=UPI003F4EB7EE